MSDGVRDAKFFLALISPQYFDSKWTTMELREAIKQEKNIGIAYNGSKSEVNTALGWIPDEFKHLTKEELIMFHEDDEFFQVSKRKLESRLG